MFSDGPNAQPTRREILNIVGELGRSLFMTVTDTDVVTAYDKSNYYRHMTDVGSFCK